MYLFSLYISPSLWTTSKTLASSSEQFKNTSYQIKKTTQFSIESSLEVNNISTFVAFKFCTLKQLIKSSQKRIGSILNKLWRQLIIISKALNLELCLKCLIPRKIGRHSKRSGKRGQVPTLIPFKSLIFLKTWGLSWLLKRTLTLQY